MITEGWTVRDVEARGLDIISNTIRAVTWEDSWKQLNTLASVANDPDDPVNIRIGHCFFGWSGTRSSITEAWWIMSVEQSVEWMARETEVLGKNLLQCFFVHYKSHMTWRGLGAGPPRCVAGDQPPGLRYDPPAGCLLHRSRNQHGRRVCVRSAGTGAWSSSCRATSLVEPGLALAERRRWVTPSDLSKIRRNLRHGRSKINLGAVLRFHRIIFVQFVLRSWIWRKNILPKRV
jgi:hypothetical protein